MNAIAGGGTILTFPVLLAFGMPAIQANATSTVALLVGTIGSAYGYREHMAAARVWIGRFAVVSVVGGLLGALLLTRTPEHAFKTLVPFLLLFATVLFMAQNAFKHFIAREALHKQPGTGWTPLLLQFFVAVYGGFFGAGIGILMLAVFGLMGLHHIHEMNTLKTILSALINVVAAIYFTIVGLVEWPQAVVMTIGATIGYFAGASLTQKIPQKRVRQLVTAIGLSISAAMFWKQFS
ncbi:sulfite exporter TauE/SafE family protein [soil metagenome]